MKTILSVLVAGLVVTTALLMNELWRRPPPPQVGELRAATSSPSPRQAESPPAPSAVRQQIRQVVEKEVTSLKDERDVDEYLDDLVARARRNHRVTALEVEPGREAILRLAPRLGFDRAEDKLAAFLETMVKLSAEFDGRDLNKLHADVLSQAAPE